jgi:hypothetical protein
MSALSAIATMPGTLVRGVAHLGAVLLLDLGIAVISVVVEISMRLRSQQRLLSFLNPGWY